MRVAYYTHPAFFEPALQLCDELARQTDIHLLLEVAPAAWHLAGFDAQPGSLAASIQPADPIVRPAYPAGVRARWAHAQSFDLVVHRSRRSLHPSSWRVSRDVIAHLRRLRPDIVHIDDPDLLLRLGLATADLRQFRIVVTSHDPRPHAGEEGWRKTLARRLIYPRAGRFVVHGEAMRRAMLARYHMDPSKVAVVRLAPYSMFADWPEPEATTDTDAESPTILFFGRLSPYKGLETLLSALPLVAARVPRLRVVIAGRAEPGYRLPPLPHLPNRGRLEVLAGYQANASLVALVRGATVLACPYTDASQSGVVMTAFGLGRPVVATTVGSLPEYVEDGTTGLLVPPGEPESLAEALRSVLVDEALRRRLEAGVQALTADGEGWAHAAEATLAVYRDALAAPSGPHIARRATGPR